MTSQNPSISSTRSISSISSISSSPSAALALLVPVVLFLVNLLMHNLAPVSGSRFAYYLVVILPAGTLLPLAVLGWLKARHGIDPHFWGGRFEPLKLAGALAVGLAMASFPVGRAIVADPAHAFHLFVWIFMTSVVEVLVFLGVAYNVVYALAARVLPWWCGFILAALAASALFGLYHFSYSPPWNTPAVALTVAIVWLAVTAVYALTRSLWAAVIFNNVMAVLGFMLNRVTALDGEPLAFGLALDGALVALSVLVWSRLGRGTRAGEDRVVAA